MKRLKARPAPTPLLAALAVVAGLPALAPGGAWIGRGLTVLLLLIAGVDLLISRRRMETIRHVEPVLSLGADNPVQIELRSSGAALSVEVRDDLPRAMALAGDWPVARLSGHEWSRVEYRVRPTRRGQYAIGPLHVRYPSFLRLWRWHHTFAETAAVRVYPNLLAARQWEIAIRQGKHLEGLKRSRVRGGGTEFESLRDYQSGDQYRTINWPASARQGKLISTLYQTDRSQPVMLLIDAGRVMIPQLKGLAKLDHTLNAALLLATVAAERGDQCGLMLFGGEVKKFMPPRKGRGQVLSMVEALYDVEPEQVEPDYGRMIAWLRARHKKRSLIVFFTDLVDPEVSRSLVEHLSALAAHHLVLLVSLTDPELLRLARLSPSGAAEVYQKTAALEVLAQRADLEALLQSRGVLVVDVPPEEFSTAVVNQYLTVKEQGRL